MTHKELVTAQLQNYAEGRRELEKMEELLASRRGETFGETIEAMTFPGQNDEERVQTSGHSDPTSRIARLFRRVNMTTNRLAREELRCAIEEMRAGLHAVKSCVEALPGRPRRILELLYFQEKTWEEVAEMEDVSIQTLSYHRKKGIEKMAVMLPYQMMAL